jgi:hypothetical protein
MPPKSFPEWLPDYLAYEQNVVDISRSSIGDFVEPGASALEVVKHFYRDKLSQFRASTHAYSETGPLQQAVLLHRGTVKELFPVATPEAAEMLLGIPLDTLRWLVSERLVLLLIQNPERYRDLTFLHPLLMAGFPPACYEIRDRAIYTFLSDGEYDRLLRRGGNHRGLGFDQPFPKMLWEPYEMFVEEPSGRWLQRNVQRYAALSALLGPDALDEILAIPTGGEIDDANVHAARSRFFYLHRHILHPVTQGLGGLPYVSTSGTEAQLRSGWTSLGSEIEHQLGEAVGVRLPTIVTPELIETVHSSTLPDEFEALEQRLLTEYVWETEGRRADVAAQVKGVVAELEDMARGFEAHYVERPHGVLRIAAIGGAIELARHSPEASVGVSSAAALPRSAVATLVDSVHRVFRRSYLPWQYWHLNRAAAALRKSPHRSAK